MLRQLNQGNWIGNYLFTEPVVFNSFEFSVSFWLNSGVYAIYCPDIRISRVSLAYIGKSAFLKNRLNLNHEAIQKMIKRTGCSTNQIYVAYHYESNQTKCNLIEQELIERFRPDYNTQHTGARTLAELLNQSMKKKL